ncbi:hypothetical protein, partial [Streptomyces sp. NPDC006996]|uniref:hypothetical protein n=1 Tax=Streptomyces sp. NPDC006996 TaxID=3156908 RepID=UPI0033D31F95
GPPTHYASLAPADSNASATNSPADEFSNRVLQARKAAQGARQAQLASLMRQQETQQRAEEQRRALEDAGQSGLF